MQINKITSGPVETNAYIFWKEDGGDAIIIDCPPDSKDSILPFVKTHSLNVVMIVNTHGHFDHVADNAQVKKTLGAPILIHQADEWRIVEPFKEAFPIPLNIQPSKADKYLKEGDTLSLGNIANLVVIETPGHTKGGVCLFDKEHKILFSGDLLFRETVGRWDFADSNYEELLHSLSKIALLEDDVVVYPGHGSSTTIAHEKKHNPFFRPYPPSEES